MTTCHPARNGLSECALWWLLNKHQTVGCAQNHCIVTESLNNEWSYGLIDAEVTEGTKTT
jgi:hypothetical protein